MSSSKNRSIGKTASPTSLSRYRTAIDEQLVGQNSRIWESAKSFLGIDQHDELASEKFRKYAQDSALEGLNREKYTIEHISKRTHRESIFVRLSFALFANELAIDHFVRNEIEDAVSLLVVSERALGAAEEYEASLSIKSHIASSNAKRRHEETYVMRKEVQTYWKKNIDSKISNDKAASLLEKVFPLSHRKLAEYVALARKELRPAGKA